MIILSTGTLWPYGLNRIFEIAKQSGFGGIELMLRSKKDVSYCDYYNSGYLKLLEKTSGVKIYSFHVPFDFEENQKSFNTILLLAQEIKIKNIVIHVPREDQFNYINWFNNEYLKNYQKYRSIISVENIIAKPGKSKPILVTVKQLSNLPHVTLDISYCLRSELDVCQFSLGLTNIIETHISYWNGVDDHMNILGHAQLYKKILTPIKTSLWCLELSPKAFVNIYDRSKVIKELSHTRLYLESIKT